MKSEFQAKFLQNLLKKRENEGFTLIELLVVIIIIGILSAIALPSFLNQANKARESEAKQYTGSMNRAQQAFFLEQSNFTQDFGRLGLGIQSNTTNYVYSIGIATGNDGYQVGAAPAGNGKIITSTTADASMTTNVINAAGPKNTDTLRAYIGVVDVATEQAGTAGAATTTAVLCQSTKPNALTASMLKVNIATNTVYPACTTDAETLE